MADLKIYYVYGIEVSGILRYIGKGKLNRAYGHVKHAKRLIEKRSRGETIISTLFYNKLAAAIKRSEDIRELLLSPELTELEAFNEEKRLIAQYGKINAEGTLWNTCDGGRGMTSEEVRFALNQPHVKKKVAERYARPEVRKQFSDEMFRRWRDPEFRAKQLARLAEVHASNSDKASKQMKERWKNQEYKKEHSEKIKRSMTPEHRALLSQRMKSYHASHPEARKRCAEGLRKHIQEKGHPMTRKAKKLRGEET